LTFAAADAKCVNQGGNTKCSFTQDVPGPGAIPPNFVAALAANVPGSIDTFIKSTVPPAPVGFLGNGGAAVSAVTTAVGAPAAIVTLTDPLLNTGTNGPTGSFSTLVGKITGMEVQPGANIDLGRTNMIIPPAVQVPRKVTVTNTTGFPLTFPLLVTTGTDPVDFIITSPSATVVAGEVGCSGAAGLALGANCNFDVTFRPAAVAKAARSANILLAPTAAIAANNPPPVTMTLTGTAEVDVTITAVGHGTITPVGTTAQPAGTIVTLTAAPESKKFKIKEVADGATLLGTPPGTPPFTINTAAVNHTVTATFMPSGDLDANGTLDVADAIKAMKIVAGVQKADADDPDNTAVKVAPLVGGRE
jgi:hypothetical protein